jgi:hypothetical protein
VNPLSWAKFFAVMLPELSELGRELYKRHKGHLDSARAELALIRDHGARLHAAEAAIDARLDRLGDRDVKPDNKV